MILVTGTSGFVGGKILNMSKDTIACPSLRNASEDEIRRIVLESGADIIIHTAAISDIGECEKDPDASYIANVQHAFTAGAISLTSPQPTPIFAIAIISASLLPSPTATKFGKNCSQVAFLLIMSFIDNILSFATIACEQKQ